MKSGQILNAIYLGCLILDLRVRVQVRVCRSGRYRFVNSWGHQNKYGSALSLCFVTHWPKIFGRGSERTRPPSSASRNAAADQRRSRDTGRNRTAVHAPIGKFNPFNHWRRGIRHLEQGAGGLVGCACTRRFDPFLNQPRPGKQVPHPW